MSDTATRHDQPFAGGTANHSSAAVRAGTVVVGVSGVARNAAVAAVVDGRLVAACEQERLTRVRSAGLQPGVLPTEALHAVLQPLGYRQSQVRAFVTAESKALLPAALPCARLDHHYAHAATAVLTSPASTAAVLVCDTSDVPVSVWNFEQNRLVNQGWAWASPGFAALYSECARLCGFAPYEEHKLEALARIGSASGADVLRPYIQYRDGSLVVRPEWTSVLQEMLGDTAGPGALPRASAVASSFQQCLGDALVAFVRDIRATTAADTLCVGGGLFYNTYLNTRVAQSDTFLRVFVPVNPGNAGIAAGAALAQSQGDRLVAERADPFLGPEYTLEEVKATLDNCKLTYEFLSDRHIVSRTVEALTKGALVGWFQGRMEWGHRALGHRTILANPFSPHVLENLNMYLKHRERYRAYGVSVNAEEAPRYFSVPARSDFMELEYAPLDAARFRHILPDGARATRVQTIGEHPSLFRDLHAAFGQANGAGVLVNTSFNGFHEPMVCSPRDAVRVFYGTGLDLLVLGRFLVRK